MEETTRVTEGDGFVIQNLTRTNATSKIGLTFVETKLLSADKSDLIMYNGPVIFKTNEKIASLFTHIKQDDIVEPDEEFSYSFKNVATRSKRAPNQQGNGKVTIGNSDPNTDSSEYDLISYYTLLNERTYPLTYPISRAVAKLQLLHSDLGYHTSQGCMKYVHALCFISNDL